MKPTNPPIQVLQWKMMIHSVPLYLVASANGLRGAYWWKVDAPMSKSLVGKTPEVRMLARAARQIEEYLAGERDSFDLPLEVEGTEFQKRVWTELAKIPYGETYSYREIAKRIGSPRAVRAVGTANGRNPVSIVVPCHRVISASGALGGYAGGLPTKRRLLELERKRRI